MAATLFGFGFHHVQQLLSPWYQPARQPLDEIMNDAQNQFSPSGHRRQFSTGSCGRVSLEINPAQYSSDMMMMDSQSSWPMSPNRMQWQQDENVSRKRKWVDDGAVQSTIEQIKMRKIKPLRQIHSHNDQSTIAPSQQMTKGLWDGMQACCKICQTTPTSKFALSGYFSCSRCKEWTCSVCQRLCETTNCKYNVEPTCSTCCVEEGWSGASRCRACTYKLAPRLRRFGLF